MKSVEELFAAKWLELYDSQAYRYMLLLQVDEGHVMWSDPVR